MEINPLYKRLEIQPAAELIKRLHPFHSAPYIGADKIWSIGYGHTRTVRGGMTISKDQADQLLYDDLTVYWRAVERLLSVTLNNNQLNAMIVFCAHIGVALFEKSNLLKLLNKGWYDQVPAQLIRWSDGGAGKHKVRRAAEIELWKKPVETEEREEDAA